eukprot:7801923-Karenia_brevis.AAC.1
MAAVRHFHSNIITAFKLAVEVDQLDDEIAVSCNPRQPDYGGLEAAMASPVDEKGAASVSGFSEWLNA